MLRNLIGPSLNGPLNFVLTTFFFGSFRGWAYLVIQERSSLVMIRPRTEAALDAASKSFNLVIVESDTK